MADKKLELDAVRAALTKSVPAGFRSGEGLSRETDAKVGKLVPEPRVSSAMVGKMVPAPRISSAMVGKQLP